MPLQTSAQQTSDSLKTASDTLSNQDTLVKKDTLKIPQSSSALKSPIVYKAKDSIIYDIANKQVYLYGDVSIHYEDIDLTAAKVTYNWQKNALLAEPGLDSAGKIAGYPVFKQGNTTVKTKTISYNFISKKGRVSGLITQEGEGFIRGDTVKTVYEGKKQVSFVKNGIYTTCDYAKVPGHEMDYYFKTRKLKLISGDKIISGMANMYIEGVPTPLIIPFGFFPANSRKTSGIIPPSVLYSQTKGYALHGAGLYLSLSKYFDAALTGDIYTKGDYLLQEATRYARRYHYSGAISFSIARNSYGLEDAPGFRRTNDYLFTWSHTQDPKAHPGNSFTASVNFPSSHYVANNQYYTQAVLEQNVSSSITYAKSWQGTPFSMTVAAQHSIRLNNGIQTEQLSTAGPNMNLTLPNISFYMTRIFPFKSSTGKKRWYSDIGFSSNLNIVNQLGTTDTTFTSDVLNYNKYRSEGQFSLPVSTAFRVLKWFTLSPTVNYNAYLYTRKYFLSDYTRQDSVAVLAQNGLYVAHEANASVNLTTNIYGTYRINRGRLIALRHVLTPSIAAQYRPDFGGQIGYYQRHVADSVGTIAVYSPFAGYNNLTAAPLGVPMAGKQGGLSFSLHNNLELKVRTHKDTTTATKKIRLLDALDINGSYNFLDTSFFKLSAIVLSARTVLFDRYSVQWTSTFNPYATDANGRLKPEYLWDQQHKLATLTNGNLALSADLKRSKNPGPALGYNPLYNYFFPLYYADFSLPWNAGITFNLLYNRYPAKTIDPTVYINGGFNLTPKWQIAVNTGYDFSSKQISLTRITINRDLHCWAGSVEWTPFGPWRSYMFNLHIKASSLKDLKLEKQKAFYDF